MKKIVYTLIILGLISCQQNTSVNKELNSDNQSVIANDSEKVELITNEDTLENKIYQVYQPKNRKQIEPDFFQITEANFNLFKSGQGRFFTNGQDKLYVITYTDYSITTAILTNEEIKDLELIHLLKSEGIYLNRANKSIKTKPIKSQKGIKLGLSINEVIEIFGTPDIQNQVSDKKNLIWNFSMLESDSELIGRLRPFPVNGLKFMIDMTFTNEQLTRVVYRYEVP
jgi:hypothetical protein